MPRKASSSKLRSGSKRARRAHLASIRPSGSVSSSDAAEDRNDGVTSSTSVSSPPSPLPSSSAPCAIFSSPPPPSSSAAKLSCADSTNMTHHPSSLPTTIVDLNCLLPLFSGFRCTQCRGGNFKLCCDTNATLGFVLQLAMQCDLCGFEKPTVYTSSRMANEDRSFVVNRSAVAAAIINGTGRSGLVKFCEVMDMPVMSERAFSKHAVRINASTKTFKKDILSSSAQEVRKAYGVPFGPLDINVSYDGSWLTRGHKSNCGVGCVIERKTGLVIDFHEMCKYCKLCVIKEKELNEADFLEWKDSHQCGKNFDGTPGAMEVEGAITCWTRSLDTHNFRYVSVLSDGDCKTVKKLNEIQPYEGMNIEKQECVNHVSKRLGKALRDLVDNKRKIKITLGGNGVGRLTKKKMDKLQKYFSKAIRSKESVEDMKRAVMATFYHCSSTDALPCHDSCDEGTDSWCFYQRALARDEEPPSHKDNLSCYLSPEVAVHVKEVYEKLSTDDLLARCLEGKTQNANESLHSVLWTRCPKHKFVNKERFDTSLAIGVGEFNQGSSATHKFLALIGLNVGHHTVKLGSQRDRKRLYDADYDLMEKNKKRKLLREAAKRKEYRELMAGEEEREGEALYLAGGGD